MNDFLSNNWITAALSNYSIAIAAIPVIIGMVLKIIAILNPNIPTDKIRDLLTWKKD
jgi:hypothetical protein